MNFVTKFTVFVIGIVSTIVTSTVSVVAWMDHRNEARIEASARVITREFILADAVVVERIASIDKNIVEIHKNVRVLIKMQRKAVGNEDENGKLYTQFPHSGNEKAL